MLVGYCVRRAGEPGPEPGLAGVGGAAVRLLEAPHLGLWLSESAGEGAEMERLREHDAVVRTALGSATPLPLRFGTLLRDEDAARELLEERRDEFLGALERVAGRVEMGIRVLWERPGVEAPAPKEVHSGTEFLERKRRELRAEEGRRREAEELLGEIDRQLAPLALPTARSVLALPDVAGTLAHLVQRSEVPRYLQDVEGARASLPHVRLRLSGPWAPYSFV
jgi:hypothetical protein